MSSEKSTSNPQIDNLPSAGVTFHPASPEQLQMYRDDQEALARFKRTMSPFAHADLRSMQSPSRRKPRAYSTSKCSTMKISISTPYTEYAL